MQESLGRHAPPPEDCAFEPLAGNVLELANAVEYAGVVLSADITAPALVALTEQILGMRGAAPVGEIGKLLQEATGNAVRRLAVFLLFPFDMVASCAVPVTVAVVVVCLGVCVVPLLTAAIACCDQRELGRFEEVFGGAFRAVLCGRGPPLQPACVLGAQFA